MPGGYTPSVLVPGGSPGGPRGGFGTLKHGKNAEAEALYKRASAGRERPHMARSIRDLNSLETEGPCDEASEATTTRSNVPPDSPHVPAAELTSETPELSDTSDNIRVAL